MFGASALGRLEIHGFLIAKEIMPKMAASFRLVNYDNLPI